MKHFALFQKMTSLRAAAALLFDKATIKGIPKEQVAKDLEPIQKALSQAVEAAPIAEKIHAIKAFQAQKTGHDEHVQYLLNKIHECEHHAEQIKQTIIRDMKAKNLEQIAEDDFIVTLTKEGEELMLTIR